MRSAWIGSLLGLVLLLQASPGVAQQDLAIDELYALACATCHGAVGEGLAADHPNYATFDPLPADLTAPLFNSREPEADWFLVIKYGGARLGLSAQMPAYGEALDDTQIDALVGYLKGLAPGAERYPPGDLNFPRPVRTIKAFPEDEALLLWRQESDRGPDALRTTAYWAARLGARFQVELKGSQSKRGGASEDEVELGLKWAFHDALERSLLMAAGFEVEIPLDGGDDVWIPYLSLGKGLSANTTFQATARAHLPASDFDAGDVEVSGVVHWATSQWPRGATPALEVVLREPFAAGMELEATLLPQVLIGLSKSGHVAFAVGAELPLSGIDWDSRVHAFLLWDIADGPFWKGW